MIPVARFLIGYLHVIFMQLISSHYKALCLPLLGTALFSDNVDIISFCQDHLEFLLSLYFPHSPSHLGDKFEFNK